MTKSRRALFSEWKLAFIVKIISQLILVQYFHFIVHTPSLVPGFFLSRRWKMVKNCQIVILLYAPPPNLSETYRYSSIFFLNQNVIIWLSFTISAFFYISTPSDFFVIFGGFISWRRKKEQKMSVGTQTTVGRTTVKKSQIKNRTYVKWVRPINNNKKVR